MTLNTILLCLEASLVTWCTFQCFTILLAYYICFRLTTSQVAAHLPFGIYLDCEDNASKRSKMLIEFYNVSPFKVWTPNQKFEWTAKVYLTSKSSFHISTRSVSGHNMHHPKLKHIQYVTWYNSGLTNNIGVNKYAQPNLKKSLGTWVNVSAPLNIIPPRRILMKGEGVV